MRSEGWRPVVYGRTNRVDRWWRALPPTMDPAWARHTVLAATANGIGLEGGPRLVLAQDRAHRLVGGACLARDLSATMHSDGQRELYCFVGWASPWCGGWDHVPSFPELAASFTAWAAPVYDYWMTLDWDLHESQLPDCRHSDEQPAPWHLPSPPNQQALYSAPASSGVAWPQACAEVPWDTLRTLDGPGLLVTGWRRLSDVPQPSRGWVTAYDIDDVVVHDQPPVRPDPSSERASPPAPIADPAHRKLASVNDEQTFKPPGEVRPHGGGIPRAPREADAADLLVRRAWTHAGQIPPAPGDTADVRMENHSTAEEREDGRLALLRRVARRLRPRLGDDDEDAESRPPKHTDVP